MIRSLLSICLCLLSFSLSSQDVTSIRISGKFENRLLNEFLAEVQEQHHVRIFFPSDLLQEFFIDGGYNNELLINVINDALTGTGFSAIIYGRYLVIIRDAFGSVSSLHSNGSAPTAVLNGFVADGSTGDKMVGATVFIEELKLGTASNNTGYFSLTLPAGQYTVSIAYVNYLTEKRRVNVRGRTTLEVDLFEKSHQLNEITINEYAHDVNVSGMQMGRNTLDVKTLRTSPRFLGEVDVMRNVLLLPGVSTVGEAASGFNVRGGNADQNLILFDNAPIFNPSHLFGFFSAFNGNIIKDATLFRGGIPARYGGRISSVMDIQSKIGNMSSHRGSGGIGPISANLAIEGPIHKDKASFVASGRTSYSNWILRHLPDKRLRKSRADFYDFNLKLTHNVDERNTLQVGGYMSRDGFQFSADTTFSWGNQSITAKWARVFNDKLFANFSAAFSRYGYEVEGNARSLEFLMKSRIDYRSVQTDFFYDHAENSKFEFGVQSNAYRIQSAELTPTSSSSSINSFSVNPERALEHSLYVNHEWSVSDAFSVSYGVRYSLFQSLGPGNVYVYEEGLPRNLSSIIDSVSYSRSDVVQQYHGWEPRISLKYMLSPNSSVKFGAQRMYQYVHAVSNTAAITPIDIWTTSGEHVKPMRGDQISLGYFRNVRNNTIETSAELYYKSIENLIDYKEGAELLLQPRLETELLAGRGRAYGVEVAANKKRGTFTGWASYTYSRTERRVDGVFEETQINGGRYFPSNYDRPHNFTAVVAFDLNRRVNLSSNFTYNTGRPVTYPESQYSFEGYPLVQYAGRNQHRIPDYYRLDVSLSIEGSQRRQKRWHGSYHISIYNLLARRNAYSVFFRPRGPHLQAYQLSILGTIFPSFSYNFRF